MNINILLISELANVNDWLKLNKLLLNVKLLVTPVHFHAIFLFIIWLFYIKQNLLKIAWNKHKTTFV